MYYILFTVYYIDYVILYYVRLNYIIVQYSILYYIILHYIWVSILFLLQATLCSTFEQNYISFYLCAFLGFCAFQAKLYVFIVFNCSLYFQATLSFSIFEQNYMYCYLCAFPYSYYYYYFKSYYPYFPIIILFKIIFIYIMLGFCAPRDADPWGTFLRFMSTEYIVFVQYTIYSRIQNIQIEQYIFFLRVQYRIYSIVQYNIVQQSKVEQSIVRLRTARRSRSILGVTLLDADP